MAVQDAEAPRGRDEQAGAGEQHAHEPHRQLALRAGEAGGDETDHERRREDAEQHQHRDAERQQREDRARRLRGGVVLAAGAQRRVDRDERAGERPFAEQVLEQVGDAERLVEGVGRLGLLAEIFREQRDADEARQAADEDAGADRGCRHARVRAAECVQRCSRPATRTTP